MNGGLRCWDDEPDCNCANASPRPADVTREPTGGQGLREAMYRGLALRGFRPSRELADLVLALPELAALIADAERVQRGRDLADELDVYVAARGNPAAGSYDDGVNRAQANAAARIRRALDGEPQP